MSRHSQVRYVGVSNETSYGVAEFCAAAKQAGLPKIQTIQNSYHLLNRINYETDLAETCRRHNVSLMAYSPLAGGCGRGSGCDGGGGGGGAHSAARQQTRLRTSLSPWPAAPAAVVQA
jgi:aryl-alcohol dehydrogenase-like predicted oxidoreductase